MVKFHTALYFILYMVQCVVLTNPMLLHTRPGTDDSTTTGTTQKGTQQYKNKKEIPLCDDYEREQQTINQRH